MRVSYLFFLLLSICLFAEDCRAQSDSAANRLTSFIVNANTFNYYLPQEKVYLHTDNSEYFLGETVWFKAYVVTSELNKPTYVSKVLYVELLSPEGAVLTTKKYEIVNGQCHGEIYLDTRSFYSGFHELRAYTRYMTNFDRESVFSRVLPVYSFPEKEGDYQTRKITGSRILREKLREKKPERKAIDIAFFPEGGHLVQGLKSQLAFKATDKDGKSISVEGCIYNARHEPIQQFSSLHRGMGAFLFLPGDGEYTAEITSGRQKRTVKLPPALPQGYVLNVDNADENRLRVGISRTPGTADETLGLAVLVRGKVYFFGLISFGEDNSMNREIDKGEFPAGVGQALLFNSEGHVLSDRLLFIHKKDVCLSIQAETDQSTYAPFEQVHMNFSIHDGQGTPVLTTFSLSVKDRGTGLSPVHGDNLLTNLLLSSDIKGMIEHPSYYFESDDRTHRNALDLLMLTQGWRRYQWEELSGQTPVDFKQKAEKNLLIDGTVKSGIRKLPGPDLDVELIMTQRDSTGYYGQNMLTGYCRTDKDGHFEFQINEPLYGEWETLIQAKDRGKRKDSRIMIDRFFAPVPASYSPLALEFASVDNKELFINEETDSPLPDDSLPDINRNDRVLPEVTVQGERPKRKKEEKLSSSLIIYDVNEQYEDLIDKGEEEYDRVVDFLRAVNPSFMFNSQDREGKKEMEEDKKDKDITAFYSDKGYYTYIGHPVMFLLDNKPLIEQAWHSVDNISMSIIDKIVIGTSHRGTPSTVYDKSGNYDTDLNIDVRYLEKTRDLPPSDYFHQSKGMAVPMLRSDIVYIFLHSKPNMKSVRPAKGVRNTLFEGYAVSKEFYSPVYEYKATPEDADYRRTLYWNPNVVTDKDGKAQVSFYNNGSASAFSIAAEAMTEDGKLGVLNKQ
jgi:hypothetical protein